MVGLLEKTRLQVCKVDGKSSWVGKVMVFVSERSILNGILMIVGIS